MPLADLAHLLPRRRYHHDKHLPAFTGGLVGYAGYDTIRYYEGEKLPAPPQDDRHLPDLLFGLYNELVIFDHVDKTIKVVAHATVKEDANQAYRDACRRVDEIVHRLSQPPTSKLGEIDTEQPLTLAFSSNMTREQYEAAVEKGKEYIRAGDIFQFVPSQRLRVQSEAAPFDVYRALRIINPSPFMFFLKSPVCTLIGCTFPLLTSITLACVMVRVCAFAQAARSRDVVAKAAAAITRRRTDIGETSCCCPPDRSGAFTGHDGCGTAEIYY